MICPRCRGNNPEENEICSNCGLKLKITCPRCKSPNPIGQEKCFNCNLRLIHFCPECKAPNHPTVKNCRKCKAQLLKECPECKILNPVNAPKCLKCGSEFEIKESIQSPPKIQQEKPEIPSGLSDYAVLSAELINLSAIKTKIKFNDVFVKLQNRFYDIIAAEGKRKNEISKKLSDQVMAVEFKNAKSTKFSAVYAILAAQRILGEIKELNFHIQSSLKVTLKVKIGISIVNTKDKPYYSQIERSIATANNIITSAKLHSITSDKFDFETVGPLPISNKMMTFYKIKEPVLEIIKPKEEIPEPEKPYTRQEAPSEPEIQEETAHHEEIAEENKTEIPKEQELKDIQFTQEKNVSQDNAHAFLTNALTKFEEGFILGISAPDGIGKTTLVNSVRMSLVNEKILWLIGQCQHNNRIIPFGFFQDMFKTLLNLPSYTVNIDEAKKAISDTIDRLEIKDKQAENVLRRLLLYELNVDSSDLFKNQDLVFESILTIFNAINEKARVVLWIDDFEDIDNASLECIKYLIHNGLLDKKVQIVINHSVDTNLSDYFPFFDLDQRIFKLRIKPMTDNELNKALLAMLNNQDIIPDRLKDKIFKDSQGSPLYLEQILWLLFQTGVIFSDNNILKFNPDALNKELPNTVEGVIIKRFTELNLISSNILKVILSASLFGQKFQPVLVQEMVNLEKQEFSDIIQYLLKNGIFTRVDQNDILFKHRIIREIIYKQVCPDEQRPEYHRAALQALKKYTRSNGAILAVHAELAGLSMEAVNYWNQAAKEAVSVGDINSYTVSQQRVLGLVEQIDFPDNSEKEALKLGIYEQLGKINHEANPQESIKYLSNAIIEREKKEDTIKVIELTGYLARSCELLGNYAGAVECSDKALMSVDKENMPVEHALLNYSKLEALYNLGRVEEAIVLAQTEIIPVLKEAISKGKTIPGLTFDDLSYIEVESELIMAKALAVQGNKGAINIANAVILKASELGFVDIEAQAKLIDALFKTIQGETKLANAVLEYLKDIIPKVKDNNIIKLYWGIVNILAGLFEGNFETAGKISYSVLALAEEYKEYNIKTIVKLLIGKILKEQGEPEKAKAIFNELIHYCSEYKMATGALLSWYLIADISMSETNTEEALNITEKALEVSQKAGINNHIFTILLQRLTAENLLIKGDFESAHMYLEQALNTAKKMDLYLFQSKLYLTLGKLYQELSAVSPKNKEENAGNAHKSYIKSLDLAQKLENEYMIAKIEEELTNLSTFCQLSGIKI